MSNISSKIVDKIAGTIAHCLVKVGKHLTRFDFCRQMQVKGAYIQQDIQSYTSLVSNAQSYTTILYLCNLIVLLSDYT